MAVLFAMAKTPSLAIETDYASKLPEVVQTLKPSVQLIGYRHGGGTTNTGNASAIIPAGTTRSCSSYQYYDCAPYGGGGGGHYKERYYNGGGY